MAGLTTVCLGDPAQAARLAADGIARLRAFGRGHPNVRPGLRPMLEGLYEDLARARRAQGDAKAAQFAPKLKRMLDDPHPDARYRAAQTLLVLASR